MEPTPVLRVDSKNLADGSLLQSTLNKRREYYNTLFTSTRHAKPKLTAEAFKTHLKEFVAPILDAVQQVRPDRIETVTESLYQASLELVGGELIGQNARYHAIDYAWRSILPKVPALLAADPAQTIRVVTNASHNIEITDNADFQLWGRHFTAIANLGLPSKTTFDGGKIAAWRAGLAHYRDSALKLISDLPLEATATALGLNSDAFQGLDPKQIELALVSDPWLNPQDVPKHIIAYQIGGPVEKHPKPPGMRPMRLCIIAKIGGFRGFGGKFIRPPFVFSIDGKFFASDGQDSWMVSADSFGSTIVKTSIDNSSFFRRIMSGGNFSVCEDGAISFTDPTVGHTCSAVLAELSPVQSICGVGRTLIIQKPNSHHLFVVAPIAD